jgi:hypothetical protein
MRCIELASLVLAGALVATAAAAQDSASRSRRDTTKTQVAAGHVARATVPTNRLLGIYYETAAANDSVEIIDLLAGVSYFVQKDRVAFAVRHVGLAEARMIATIGPADTTPITVYLEKVNELPTIRVNATAPRSEIAERGRFYGISFIPPGMLRTPAYESKSLADALRENKINVEWPYSPQVAGSKIFGPRQGGQSQCVPRVILDHSVKVAGVDVKPDDRADMYDGAEFYPKHHDMPLEYGSNSGPCGTLVLTTRGR